MGTIFVDNIKDNVGGKEINIGDGSLSVTSDGKVGINTTSPSDDLEITTSADEKGLTLKTTSNIRPYINLESNRSAAGNNLAQINFLWNGTKVASILGVAGSDTSNKDDAHLIFATAAAGSPTQIMRINNSGTVGISTDGSNFTTSGDSGAGLLRGFTVQHDSATNFVAEFRSEGNNANRYGMIIAYGADDNHSSTATAIEFLDGDNTSQGKITSTNGTVNYGAFTANHDCYLPDADKQTGYPYGTLLECVDTTYKKSVGTGTTLERGIQYNVQKTSSKGTNAVMGAYANRYSTFYEQGDTIPEGKVIGDEKVVDKPLHQVYVLGDGHILCNNSGGNVSIGDFIVASATAGIGMKADASGMACGIARENISFSSSSETKLVAVEFGLRQYIHS